MSLWPMVTSAACRPLHGLNSICAVSTRLKPGAIDLVPPTAAESLQARVRGAATHGVERSLAQGVRRECPNARRRALSPPKAAAEPPLFCLRSGTLLLVRPLAISLLLSLTLVARAQ